MAFSTGTFLFSLISVEVVVLTFHVGQYNIEERNARTVYSDKYEKYIKHIWWSLVVSTVALIPFGASRIIIYTKTFSANVVEVLDVIAIILFIASLVILSTSTLLSINDIVNVIHER